MRLTKEATEDLVKEIAGEDTVKLVGLLKNKDNVSEFKLAEKLRLTVNTVRNMLYRLQEHNLVTSTRKKDKEKGWYIYYWTFNAPQARSTARAVKQKKLEQLKKMLKTETQETFYVCPEKCTRFKIENAMDYDFKCPECGVVLQEENNEKFIEKIKTRIQELEQTLMKPEIVEKVKPRKRLRKTIKIGKKLKIKKPRIRRRIRSRKARMVRKPRVRRIRSRKARMVRKPRVRRIRSRKVRRKPKTKKVIKKKYKSR